jgi:hypothetical protein
MTESAKKSQGEMHEWWGMQEELGALPMTFNDEEKVELEGLTGRIPILLECLRNIRLRDDLKASMAGEGHKSTSTQCKQSRRSPRFTRRINFEELLEKLWGSPQVKLAELQISKFIHNQRNRLRDSPDYIEYV